MAEVELIQALEESPLLQRSVVYRPVYRSIIDLFWILKRILDLKKIMQISIQQLNEDFNRSKEDPPQSWLTNVVSGVRWERWLGLTREARHMQMLTRSEAQKGHMCWPGTSCEVCHLELMWYMMCHIKMAS